MKIGCRARIAHFRPTYLTHWHSLDSQNTNTIYYLILDARKQKSEALNNNKKSYVDHRLERAPEVQVC